MLRNSEFSSKLCDLIFDYNLTHHVEHLTHVEGHIPDLIISNNDDSIAASGVQLKKNPLLKSDHYVVIFNLRQIITTKSIQY